MWDKILTANGTIEFFHTPMGVLNWLNYNSSTYATLPQLAEGYALEAYKSEFKSLE